jgi:hypothetical protein
MKKVLVIISLIVLLFPKLKLQGSLLFVSEKTKVALSDIFEHKYTERELNLLYSEKQLGSTVENGKTTFRIFAPNPVKAELILFENVDDPG